MKVDILAFGAHPDDVELGCGGSICSAVSQGFKVGIIDLTNGELGTRGTTEIRKKESNKAAEILGVSFRKNLGFKDGFFLNDKEHQLKVVELLREHRPSVVFCNAIKDRHIDHPKGSKLVSDASFLSGLSKIKTNYKNTENQLPWTPKHVYHYIQWFDIEPDLLIDISGFQEKKMNAIMAYTSQFYNPKSKEPYTPISSKNFLEGIKQRDLNFGRISGLEAAEGFTVERPPVFKDFKSFI
jgi:bacillithiol biosynthesis deacetylase BshB1